MYIIDTQSAPTDPYRSSIPSLWFTFLSRSSVECTRQTTESHPHKFAFEYRVVHYRPSHARPSQHADMPAVSANTAPIACPLEQAKPVRDSPELFAACFRCGASNPLLSPYTGTSSSLGSSSSKTAHRGNGGGRGRHEAPLPWGDACTTCRHPFVRSFFNFESLPLVEFQPDPGCVEFGRVRSLDSARWRS